MKTKSVLQSVESSSASAGLIDRLECTTKDLVTPEQHKLNCTITTAEIRKAKRGDEQSQLDIIRKIRLCAGNRMKRDFAQDQFYMQKDDFNQIVDLKILEAIQNWKPGHATLKNLALYYIKKAFDMKNVGHSYYEGCKSNIFKDYFHGIEKHNDLIEEEVLLDMDKIKKAIGNDRMFIALRLSGGLNGSTKMSFRELTDVIYGHSGKKISRQAIHSLVKRAKNKLKKAFTNESELIIYEEKTNT